MQLATYLEKHKIAHSAFAEQIGTSQSTVSRYAQRQRIPRREHMDKIVEVTGGAVAPGDFYCVSDPDRSRAATPVAGGVAQVVDA